MYILYVSIHVYIYTYIYIVLIYIQNSQELQTMTLQKPALENIRNVIQEALRNSRPMANPRQLNEITRSESQIV